MDAETLGKLREAILNYDAEAAELWARRAVNEGIDPIKTVDALTEAIRVIGDGFGKGELWLPDLVGAATAMKSAMPIIEDEIRRTGKKRQALGSVVVGTVHGDIHDIGKNMVATLLAANGFTVYDVGINVTSAEFVEAVRKYSPNILAMSALMTMTSYEQKNVIEALKKEGLRGQVKIMVGGGAITQQFADMIGADGYEPSAPGAVSLAKKLMGME
ncbi:MAG: cobalamin-binding protein [Chloroflexi bacterium]|nr:cobalamin-binding protein [Chloroflexota bacterium]